VLVGCTVGLGLLVTLGSGVLVGVFIVVIVGAKVGTVVRVAVRVGALVGVDVATGGFGWHDLESRNMPRMITPAAISSGNGDDLRLWR
jgi:hypothetical protein